jgi:hypothetical protein
MNERRRWVIGAGVAAAVVTAARLWTSRRRDEYSLWPDEPAQLAIARFVGGGTSWNMHNHSVWRPLFGVLLAPVYWFTDDPTSVFRVAMVLNAALGGIAAALLVFVARRLTPMSAAWCAACAVVVAVTPGVIFTTDFVFSESLVAPLYLATLLGLLRFQESPTLATGVVTGVLSAAAFGAHSRMLTLALITLGVVSWAAWRRRLRVLPAAVIGAVIVAGVYLVSASTTYVVDRLWNEPSTRNSSDGVIEQLENGSAVLVSLLGQTWYLVVASLGVVVYGAVVLVRSAVGRDSTPVSTPRRNDAVLVLLTVSVFVVLSSVFMSDRWRSDQLVYGRYNDAVVTPVLVVGLAALLGVIPLRRLAVVSAAAAVATTGAGLLLWSLRSELLSESKGLEPMILGLQPFATSGTSIDVVRISVWASLLTLALAAVSIGACRRGLAPLALATVGLLVAVGWSRTSTIVDRSWDEAGDLGAVEEVRGLVDGLVVDFALPATSNSTSRMMRYQFHLPRTEFTVVEDAVAGTSPYVFARVGTRGDERALGDAGATLIWRDPRGRYGLWER